METKTLEAAVKPSPIDEDNAKMFKHAKEMEKSTGMLLHIYNEAKHIFLCFETELSDALNTLETESIINLKEVRLRSETVLKKMEEFDKIKNRLNHEFDAFVINGMFDDNVFDELCKLSIISQEVPSIRALCFTQQVSNDKEKPIESCYKLIMERMKQNDEGYLEFSDRALGLDIRQGVTDTDEDIAPALDSVDLESSPFFPDPSLPMRDPKKSPELLHILNKIRRAHKCPEELPAGLYPVTTSQSEGYSVTSVDEAENNLHKCPEELPAGLYPVTTSQTEGNSDLEVDAPHSGRQTSPFFPQSEPSKSKTGKTGSFSVEPEKNDTNMKNVRFLLETPAAKDLLSMGYDSNAVQGAISNYTEAIGDVEFDVNDLLGILTEEDPKPRKAAVHTD